jgi:hypothetical protein
MVSSDAKTISSTRTNKTLDDGKPLECRCHSDSQ